MIILKVDRDGDIWARPDDRKLFRCVSQDAESLTLAQLTDAYGPLTDYEGRGES